MQSEYYKHLLGKAGCEITFDVSNYHMKAENSTEYIIEGTDNGISNRHHPTFESGLFAIVSFKHNIAFSFVFQYASKRNNIQDNYYCDAL